MSEPYVWSAEAQEILELASANPDSDYLRRKAEELIQARKYFDTARERAALRFMVALRLAVEAPADLAAYDMQAVMDELSEAIRQGGHTAMQRVDIWTYVARNRGEMD